MTELTCNFCNKEFKTFSVLTKHQKTAKYCLDIQKNGNILNTLLEFKCEYCDKNFLRKDHLINHLNICKDKENKLKMIQLQKKNNILHKENKELLSIRIETKEMETNYINIIKELEKEVEKLRYIEFKYNQLEIDYKELIKSNKDVTLKAIENAGTKVNNNVTNKNNIHQYIQNMPALTDEHMREQTQYITVDHVRNGAESIAKFAIDFPLKNRFAITDLSRHKFVFKDENGETVQDPNGVKLTNRFININKDVLINVINEYLEELNVLHTQACEEQDIDAIEKCQNETFSLLTIKRLLKEGETSKNSKQFNKFKDDFIKYLVKTFNFEKPNDLDD